MICTEVQRHHEIFAQNFSWMNRRQFFLFRHSDLVVVHDLNIVRVAAGPPETDSPPVIDTNTVLTGSVALQCLQSIAWWSSQITQFRCCIELSQLALSDALELPNAQNTLSPV